MVIQTVCLAKAGLVGRRKAGELRQLAGCFSDYRDAVLNCIQN